MLNDDYDSFIQSKKRYCHIKGLAYCSLTTEGCELVKNFGYLGPAPSVSPRTRSVDHLGFRSVLAQPAAIMSWDSYIDNLIAQTKDPSGGAHCDRACIIGKDGSKWTTDGHGCALKVVL